MPTRYFHFLALLLSLIIHPVSVNASGKQERQAEIHPTLGKFKFLGNLDDRNGGYILKIFNRRGKLIQTLRIEADALSKGIETFPVVIYDVDGDGYKDLVTIDDFGAGPDPSTSLYRYNNVLNQFQKDRSFPGYNIPTPSRMTGCVYLNQRISSQEGYEFTEWCLSPKDGKWSKGARCATASDPACYDEIRKYQFQWHRHNRPNG